MSKRLFKVSFTFNDSYSPKTEGFVAISLCVMAIDQFDALRVAWDSLSTLGLEEPKSFNAERINAC